MTTSYSSFESFYRSASGHEKDCYSAFMEMDDLTGSEILEKRDDIESGAAIRAKISAGHAGQTEAELLSEWMDEIEQACESAEDEAYEQRLRDGSEG